MTTKSRANTRVTFLTSLLDCVHMPPGKRDLLALGLYWSGVVSLLHCLPARDSLVVLNYHRVGNPDEDLFDPGVFSATGEQLDEQLGYLKSRVSLVTLEEAQAFVEGRLKETRSRCRVLITFDDGYLDNYEVAFPILRSHNLQGVFFLATSNVGSCSVPWWDHIAFVIKTARQRRFSLHYPAHLPVDCDAKGITESIGAVLRLYKSPENRDPHRFMQELQEQARGEELPGTMRRFLSWEEASEMIGGGMAIGSHTHSHQVLSQLGVERQREELIHSRKLLGDHLGIAVDALAYPVGARSSFSKQTQLLAQEAGYRTAFSSYGGRNLHGKESCYDVKRIVGNSQSRIHFRVQTEICRAAGKFWP